MDWMEQSKSKPYTKSLIVVMDVVLSSSFWTAIKEILLIFKMQTKTKWSKKKGVSSVQNLDGREFKTVKKVPAHVGKGSSVVAH